MGVTNIQDAKGNICPKADLIRTLSSAVLISSSKITDRTTGLKDLIHILRHNRGKSSLEVLGNKAYLALCETLFQCMRDERSSYLRSKSKTSSSKSAALLPLCATSLRHIIIAGVRTIKSSTVENIINTIVEVLPGKDGMLIKPLLEELPKALRALLEYQPHVERLSKDCWDAAVNFCLETLSSFFVESDSQPQNSWSTRASSRARTPFESTDGTAKLSSRDQPAKKQIPEEFVHTAEDFVHCLLLLTKASNAPVLEKAEHVLTTLIQFLQRKTGRGYSAALATINSILARTTLHSTDLTKRTIQDLLPLMKTLWSDPPVRDEILIALMHTNAHLSSILAERHADATSFDLETLVETIYGEYRRRQENAVLQFLEDDHLCFRHIGKIRSNTHPLNTYAFSMETEHLRCESLWATVSTIARLSSLLDDRKRMIAQSREEEEETFIKRVRVTHHFQEYLRHVSEPRSNAKRAALQVIAFIVQEGPIDEEDLQSMLEKLTAYISDENPVHSSWAMIALAA